MTYPFEITLTSATGLDAEINNTTNNLVAAMIAQEAASAGDCIDCASQEVPALPTGGAWIMSIELSSDRPVVIELGYFIPPGDTFVPVWKTYGLLDGTAAAAVGGKRHVFHRFTDGLPLEINGQANGRRLAIRGSGSAEATINVSGVLEFFKR